MMIEAQSLTKTWRSGGRAVRALDGMTMRVPRGGVHGLVGPNGAGKSTLMRILLGLVRADGGQCSIMDGPPGNAAARARVGAMIETPRLYPFLTGAAALRVLAHSFGADPAQAPALLDRVGLTDAAGRRIGAYSVGMKQRLGVAAALLGAPELLILDEPLNGLDPAGIRDMRALIADLAAGGVTILLSSHVLSEVERVCDRVTIIQAGVAAAEGAVTDLLTGARTLRIDAAPLDRALNILGDRAALRDGALHVALTRAEAPAAIAALAAGGVEVFEARWTGGDLEALFFATTERPA